MPKIANFVPPRFNKYIEPFAGSAALFFHLTPKNAVLGDINKELIFAYQQIAKRPKPIWDMVSLLPKKKQIYYAIRGTDPVELSTDARVIRFLYLNRHCFNALYRTNRSGQFNVPFGKDTGSMANWTDFHKAALQLRHATIICSDFQETLSHAKRGDFVYLDPPYADSGRNGRNEYGEGSFKPADIPRLMQELQTLHAKGTRFLLSYSSSPDFVAALRIHSPRRIQVPRMIAANPRFRRNDLEILVHNDDLF